MKWQPKHYAGQRLQAGIPFTSRPERFEHPGGMLLRGVVTATYEIDSPDHPEADAAGGVAAVAVYCDVLTYSSALNQRWQMLRSCLVSQATGGIHRGRVWKPRAATVDKNNPAAGWDLNRATNPSELDGDHVLVGFLDNNLNQPVILGGIPHPSADVGNEDKVAGKRLRLKVADGDPDFWKHHGAFFGISDAGDFVVDTTEAYVGPAVTADGKERPAVGDGSTGNYRMRLQTGSRLLVDVGGGQTLVVDLADASATMTLGDGAVSVAIADHLESLYASLKSYIEGAIVPTGVGPSGTILAGSGPAPSWDSNINSTKLLVPDT